MGHKYHVGLRGRSQAKKSKCSLISLCPDKIAVIQSRQSKSLQRSRAVGDFYGTGIEIWAGFGPVRQLLRPVFSCFHGQKKILKTLQTVKTFLAQNEVNFFILFFLKSFKKIRLRNIFYNYFEDNEGIDEKLCKSILGNPIFFCF